MSQKWKPDNIQSPLGRARGYGSAKSGVHHWMHQRITAIANIPLVIWMVWSAVHASGWDYYAFTAWLAQPVNAVLMILSVVSVFYHAALGCQVIVEDYVHHEGCRIAKLVGIRLAFFAGAVACIFSVLKVAFAG